MSLRVTCISCCKCGQEKNDVVCDWLKSGRFLSHDYVNDLITLMGQDISRRVLCRVKSAYPFWYGIIADEATDVAYNEQLSLLVRYIICG